MSKEPVAYLTCEIKGRDLDGRSLIAAHLVKLGYSVVLGQYWNIRDNISSAPRGCVLFKTSNLFQTQAMAAAKFAGHAVVASDEEALGWSEEIIASTTDAMTFDACDLFLALSAAHKRALHRAFPKSFDRVVVAGTARADLLRAVEYPAPHARPYILFNTSFALRNSIWGGVQPAVAIYAKGMGWNLKEAEPARIMRARLDYERASMRETRGLLERLIARRDIDSDIVIRPHPSENANWWRRRYKDPPRVTIVEGSDPYSWMQHAKLMVHSDSTTGIEAAIMGVPTLNISPDGPWAERLMLREINLSVQTGEQAYAAAAEFLSSDAGSVRDFEFHDPYPLDCAAQSARSIATLLPAPRPLAPFEWSATERDPVQQTKFMVSPEEFVDSLSRAFRLAGHTRYAVRPLTDSVVLVQP